MWSLSISRRAFARAVAVVGALALAASATASAATFSVNPISVTLQKGGSSATIAIINQSGQKLRLHVTGFSWKQSLAGQMELAPTDDLVFFPQLLTLNAGETRRIRVGVTAPKGEIEKTYRVFMEELPSLASIVAPAGGPELTIRMKIGVPIFVEPVTKSTSSGVVRDASVHGGSLQFDVVNTGNHHFNVSDVRVATAGGTPFSANLSGWYILAGETRHYVVPLPKGRCAAIGSVSVSVKTDEGSFKNAFSNVAKDCAATHR